LRRVRPQLFPGDHRREGADCGFWQDYFGNGQLHIVNTDTGELLGRKDAYLPMNMYFDHKGAAAELAQWKALAEQRRELDRKYGEEMERYMQGYVVNVSGK
jgi:hypothetical protein